MPNPITQPPAPGIIEAEWRNIYEPEQRLYSWKKGGWLKSTLSLLCKQKPQRMAIPTMRITDMEIFAYFTILKPIKNPVKPTSNTVKHQISSSEGRGTLRDGRGTWGREIGEGKEGKSGRGIRSGIFKKHGIGILFCTVSESCQPLTCTFWNDAIEIS